MTSQETVIRHSFSSKCDYMIKYCSFVFSYTADLVPYITFFIRLIKIAVFTNKILCIFVTFFAASSNLSSIASSRKSKKKKERKKKDLAFLP